MPGVTGSDVMCTLRVVRTQANQLPYVYVAHLELLMNGPFMRAK